MKKIRTFLLITTSIFTLLISACSGQTPGNHVVLPADDYNNIPGQTVTTVSITKTVEEQYNDCANSVDLSNPAFTYFRAGPAGQEAATVYTCGANMASFGPGATTLLLPATAGTSLTPTPIDDGVVKFIVITATVVLVAVVTYQAVAEYQQYVATQETLTAMAISAIGNMELTAITEADFDQINLSVMAGTLVAEDLVMKSLKHKESKQVVMTLISLLTASGYLQPTLDCYSSGSLCFWGGVNLAAGTGSIAITFMAGTRIAYTVITGKVFQPRAQDLLNNKALVQVAEGGWYIDPSTAVWSIALILSLGPISKEYNPAEHVSFGEGMTSWRHKQAQYGLYFPVIVPIKLPLPPSKWPYDG